MSDTTRDMAVLAAFFNPCGYRLPVKNFRIFHDALRRQGVELHFAEIALEEAPFVLGDLGCMHQIRTSCVLWQRERLVNHLMGMLPDRYTKIAWLDTDILFGNADWYAETSRLLDRVAVVQPYRSGVWLDREGMWRREKIGFNAAADFQPELLRSPRTSETKIHPGFAWAVRREILQRHGVPDFCITGAGDSVFAHAVHGYQWPAKQDRLPPGMNRRIRAWADPFYTDVHGSHGWVDGYVYHLWHGDLKNRQYVDRHAILRSFDYDPDVHLAIDENGAWRWTRDHLELNERMREYLLKRQDDGEPTI